MSPDAVPERLRRSVADDIAPVQPLPPAWMRTLKAAAVAAFGLGIIVVAFRMSLRPDMDQLPMWIGWGATAVQLGIGVLLIGLAMREAVPGCLVPRPAVAFAVALGVVMQVVVAVATWMHSPGMAMPAAHGWNLGLGCAGKDITMAVPALVVTLWLVFRALPVRPSVAGLLGGAGAAVTADAFNHLICPLSDLRHVLVWHTGAMLGLMLVGWLVGKAWELARLRRTG